MWVQGVQWGQRAASSSCCCDSFLFPPLHCLFVSAQLQYFNHLTLQDRQDVAKSPQSLIFTHSLIMRTSAVFLSFGRSQTTGISLPPTSRMNHLVFKKFLGINSETARLETAGYSSMPLCLCSHSIFLFTHKHHHRCSIIPVSSHLNQTSLMWWLPCVAFTARIKQIFLENHKSDSSICSYVWSAYCISKSVKWYKSINRSDTCSELNMHVSVRGNISGSGCLLLPCPCMRRETVWIVSLHPQRRIYRMKSLVTFL